MEISIFHLILAFTGGLGLGFWFFGGLLWTVRRVSRIRHPVLFLFLSFAIRMCVLLVGAIWLAGRHWQLLLAALLGFVMVRLVMLHVWSCPKSDIPSE